MQFFNVRKYFEVVTFEYSPFASYCVLCMTVRGQKGFISLAPFLKSKDDGYLFEGYLIYSNKGEFLTPEDPRTAMHEILANLSLSGYVEKLGGSPLPYKIVQSKNDAIKLLKHLIRQNSTVNLNQKLGL